MTENRALLDPSKDPFVLFKEWFNEASKKEINDPNAMNLSTISQDIKPSSRIVLLKDFNNKGFSFYTNSNSKKGISFIYNTNVALNFHWKSMLKQIRIEGKINQISALEADEYFNTRNEESKLGAWASNQSSKLENRKKLEENISYYRNQFKDKKITRPPHWNGFIVAPNLIEFWQDMPFRLHDRLEYKKVNDKWVSKKLYP